MRLAIERKRFPQRLPQAFKLLVVGTLLAIDAGNFLDPAEPPVAVLFHESGILAAHDLLHGCLRLRAEGRELALEKSLF
jgi:hypothetical protein